MCKGLIKPEVLQTLNVPERKGLMQLHIYVFFYFLNINFPFIAQGLPIKVCSKGKPR